MTAHSCQPVDPSLGTAGAPHPSLRDVLAAWFYIGVMSFGGPTAQIALMHRVIVEEKKWLTEQQFLNALSFCMLLPGPEAMQLATYSGWRVRGVAGGIAAGLLFVLPGAVVVLGLSIIYALFGNVPVVEAIFLGIKAAVLVIVVDALIKISRRALTLRKHWAIAGLSFVGIFVLDLPFPLIVLGALAYGYWRSADAGTMAADGADADLSVPPSLRHVLMTGTIWLAVWIVPLAVLVTVLGTGHVFSELAWFFSKLAVVTFGGAYAVLAYMSQDVVVHYGWLEAGQMMDGLGLAETTPGPLILVTEFVGFLTGYRQGGDPTLLTGLFGAAIAVWATFAPCFLWIFVGAPYIGWLNTRPRLKSALAAVTAAVVGVIFNLAVWFALHVFFADVDLVRSWPFQIWRPDFVTLDWRIVVLAAISGVLLLVLKWNLPLVLLSAAVLSLGFRLAGI